MEEKEKTMARKFTYQNMNVGGKMLPVTQNGNQGLMLERTL